MNGLFEYFPRHRYSVASSNSSIKTRYFNTREDANNYMYKLCNKLGYIITDTWVDNHDITYVCKGNKVKFYIQRAI